jgi:hypothetical protein
MIVEHLWHTNPTHRSKARPATPASDENLTLACVFTETAAFELYPDYLNKVDAETVLLKTEDFPDQKRAPSTPNSSIYNRNPFSQAGRRRFEPGLPLHLFNNLQL